MWDGGERFQRGLETLLLHPCQHPEAYTTKWNPLRRCIAILGHEFSNKRFYVEEFCTIHNISFKSHAFQRSKRITDDLRGLNYEEECQVLLLDNADRLAFNCDSVEGAHMALNLINLPAAIIICFMNRVPMHITEQAHNQEHLDAFYSQFSDAILYFSPPTTSFSKRYIQSALEGFVSHYLSNLKQFFGNRPLVLSLTDADYTFLSEATRFASIGHINKFLESVFHAFCSMYCVYKEVDASNICAFPFIKKSALGPHILLTADQLKRDEGFFAIQAGVPALDEEAEQQTKRAKVSF